MHRKYIKERRNTAPLAAERGNALTDVIHFMKNT